MLIIANSIGCCEERTASFTIDAVPFHCIGNVGETMTTKTVLTQEQLIRQAIDALIDKLDLMEATVF